MKGDGQTMESERIPADHEMLADKIRAILYFESNKKISEIDDDLIAECADFLMELEKRTCLNEKEIQEETNKIFAKSIYKNKRKISLRHLLIAAILAAILAVSYLFVSVSSNDEHIKYLLSIFNPMFAFEEQSPVYRDGKEYKIEPVNYSEEYKTFEKFYESEKLDVLYPSALPGKLSIDFILVTKIENGYTEISYVTNSIYGVTVKSGDDFSSFIHKETAEFEVINGLECYYHIFTDVNRVQCGIIRNGYIYHISAASYDEMVYIINNLKEF